MRQEDTSVYRCPTSGAPLRLEIDEAHNDDVRSGQLVSPDGLVFPIVDGIPDLTFPHELPFSEQQARTTYERVADEYDRYIHLTFDTFRTTEKEERARMVDRLALQPGAAVLEIGCGTGRTAPLIAERIGAAGRLWLQDLSPFVLAKAAEKVGQAPCSVHFSVANGCYLPFANDSFDAAFHFGGINMFSDIPRAFRELARVVRPGGMVVVGDEGIPAWLRDTETAKILINSNPFYRHDVPLAALPVCARDVHVEWIIGGMFYLISFRVGDGEPYADLDFPIPGARGGTHRTRMYGQLEGVTPEAKALANKARAVTGKSMHEWLDEVIRQAANRDIGESK
ncbi:methyltransferase domain-containing protein [Azospirillum sp. TSA6c]|uniref:methyltransferase domain-containing protein n=1 Tax=unclassified Azospirillum TaxID=2630922 RepID=UPI001304B66F|nr:methyltransferase domain-containing protein [Azospirillum sp. TSA6c]